MRQGNMLFSPMLQAIGLKSGSVYATGLLKGRDAARMVADFKAQETIHADHDRIIAEAKQWQDKQHAAEGESL